MKRPREGTVTVRNEIGEEVLVFEIGANDVFRVEMDCDDTWVYTNAKVTFGRYYSVNHWNGCECPVTHFYDVNHGMITTLKGQFVEYTYILSNDGTSRSTYGPSKHLWMLKLKHAVEAPTGGTCRHCGMHDEYPERGSDGKVTCWKCVGSV